MFIIKVYCCMSVLVERSVIEFWLLSCVWLFLFCIFYVAFVLGWFTSCFVWCCCLWLSVVLICVFVLRV